jgi:threonylcarbamoyladenosine tRNA methylthiotransferase MtaB
MSERPGLTLGCRLNAVESARMSELARQAGVEGVTLVHSCAVTAAAVKETRAGVRRLGRTHPGARLIVTGCAATLDPEAFAAMPEVHRVIPNAEKLRPETWAALAEPTETRTAMLASAVPAAHAPPTRRMIAVQNGCDHACTFCIIPRGRGPSRSRPVSEVIAEVGEAIAEGQVEVVLTGVDLTAWGLDLPRAPRLGFLVRALLAEFANLRRLRLSSVDSIELDPTLLHLAETEPRFMPHLHLSLQSGNDLILKRMRRRHRAEEVISLCKRLKDARPDFAFGADLIAGFPTETEAMFEDSLRLIERAGIAFVHAFPYSIRPGTPAARMPQLPPPVIEARARRLRAAGEAARIAHEDREIGRVAFALVERGNRARLPNFTQVALEAAPPGAILPVRIEKRHEGMLQALPLEPQRAVA